MEVEGTATRRTLPLTWLGLSFSGVPSRYLIRNGRKLVLFSRSFRLLRIAVISFSGVSALFVLICVPIPLAASQLSNPLDVWVKF